MKNKSSLSAAAGGGGEGGGEAETNGVNEQLLRVLNVALVFEKLATRNANKIKQIQSTINSHRAQLSRIKQFINSKNGEFSDMEINVFRKKLRTLDSTFAEGITVIDLGNKSGTNQIRTPKSSTNQPPGNNNRKSTFNVQAIINSRVSDNEISRIEPSSLRKDLREADESFLLQGPIKMRIFVNGESRDFEVNDNSFVIDFEAQVDVLQSKHIIIQNLSNYKFMVRIFPDNSTDWTDSIFFISDSPLVSTLCPSVDDTTTKHNKLERYEFKIVFRPTKYGYSRAGLSFQLTNFEDQIYNINLNIIGVSAISDELIIKSGKIQHELKRQALYSNIRHNVVTYEILERLIFEKSKKMQYYFCNIRWWYREKSIERSFKHGHNSWQNNSDSHCFNRVSQYLLNKNIPDIHKEETKIILNNLAQPQMNGLMTQLIQHGAFYDPLIDHIKISMINNDLTKCILLKSIEILNTKTDKRQPQTTFRSFKKCLINFIRVLIICKRFKRTNIDNVKDRFTIKSMINKISLLF
ncbi:MAG: hypothetical protein MHMPM18_001750 [Marteilia pararefringens]